MGVRKRENRGRRKGEGEWGREWGGRERESGEGSEKEGEWRRE